MANGIVNIVLSAKGGSQVSGELDKVGKSSGDLMQSIKKLGGAFGQVGSAIGELATSVLKGGVFGVVTAGIVGIVKLVNMWREAEEEAAKEAKRKTEEVVAANRKLVASIKEASAAQAASIDHNLSRREKEIDKVKELTKAEIELARQREIAEAKGDEGRISSANSKAEKLLANVDAEAAAQKIAERMEAAEERVLQRRAAADMAQYAWEEAEAMNQKLKGDYQTAEDAAVRSAIIKANTYMAMAMGSSYRGLSDSDIAKESAAAREAFANSEEGRELSKSITDHADGALKEAKKALDEANAAVQTAEEARQDASDSAALLIKNRQVAVVKQANAEAAAAKKTAEERQKVEIAAAQAAAKERERLDREAHQKRMADLRAEIAEQTRTAGSLKAVAASAQSEFDKAFAMYRDSARAEAEIGEEKDYRNDLERLHKDARRYGGKWRIDELSSLMAAGDTQGVSDTLAGWRKSRGFTPQVEAMVRASAAENAKTTVEDELRKIETNTKDLSSKLEELISMKGGS